MDHHEIEQQPQCSNEISSTTMEDLEFENHPQGSSENEESPSKVLKVEARSPEPYTYSSILSLAEKNYFKIHEAEISRLQLMKIELMNNRREIPMDQFQKKVNIIMEEIDKHYLLFTVFLKAETKRLDVESKYLEVEHKHVLKHRRLLFKLLKINEEISLVDEIKAMQETIKLKDHQLKIFKKLESRPDRFNSVLAHLERTVQEKCIEEE